LFVFIIICVAVVLFTAVVIVQDRRRAARFRQLSHEGQVAVFNASHESDMARAQGPHDPYPAEHHLL